jgi:putative addiction module killer protein
VLPNHLFELLYYVADDGRTPFEQWVADLDRHAEAKVIVALTRLEHGNLSSVKSVLFEFRIDWGPGYRVYFGRDGDVVVVLLTGGTKRRQSSDIATAKILWTDYKRRRPRAR